MQSKENYQKSLLTFLILVLFFVIYFSASYLYQSEHKKVGSFLYPPELLKHATLGYRDPMADSLWIRVIQDIGTCDQKKSASPSLTPKEQVPLEEASEEATEGVGSADNGSSEQSSSMMASRDTDQKFAGEPLGSKIKDQVSETLMSQQPEAQCRLGWVFNMIDTITDLAPKFELVYSLGATVLSIVVDDREGARLIFEKGIRQFPDDWSLSYRAAYHYLYEIKEPRRAAELLEHAGRKGAPPWVFSLAARLYTDLGRAELGITILEDALKRDYKGHGVDKIKQRLDQLYKIRDEALARQK